MRCKLAVLVGLVCVVGLMAAFCGAANAAIVASGTLDSELPPSGVGGVTATDGWTRGGFKISWTVTETENGWDSTRDAYHYEYILTNLLGGNLTQGLRQFGISLASDITMSANIRNMTYTAADPGDPTIIADWADGGYYPSGADPMSAALVFHTSALPLPLTYTVSFDSDRAPAEGDFFAADGTSVAGVPCTAYNTGLTSASGAKIAVPGEIPEPATLIIWSLLGALAITVKMRRRK
jgi:hypothetical protein